MEQQGTIDFEITVGELREKYLRRVIEGNAPITYFCTVLAGCVYGYAPDSRSVIEQFMAAKPEWFFQLTPVDCYSITTHMKYEYRNVADPRLTLLNSLPDALVLKFNMHKL